METRTINGEVTEITETGGVYVKEGLRPGSWFLSKEDLERADIAEIKVGDRLSFALKGPTPCGGGILLNLSRA